MDNNFEYLTGLMKEADTAYTKAANDYREGKVSAEYYRNIYETWVMTFCQFIQNGIEFSYYEKDDKSYIAFSISGQQYVCNANNIRGIIGNTDYDYMFSEKISLYKEQKKKESEEKINNEEKEKTELQQKLEKEKRDSEAVKRENEELLKRIKEKEIKIEEYEKEKENIQTSLDEKADLEEKIKKLTQELNSQGESPDKKTDAAPLKSSPKNDVFQPDAREPDTPWLLAGKKEDVAEKSAYRIPVLSSEKTGNIFTASKCNVMYHYSAIKVVKEKIFESDLIEFFVFPLESKENSLHTKIALVIRMGDMIEPYVSSKADSVIHAVFDNYHFLISGSFYQNKFSVNIETADETKKIGCVAKDVSSILCGYNNADIGHVCFKSQKDIVHVAPVFLAEEKFGNLIVMESERENIAIFDTSFITEMDESGQDLSIRTQWQGELFAVECVINNDKNRKNKEKSAKLQWITDNIAEVAFLGIGLVLVIAFLASPDLRASVMSLIHK